MTKIESIDSERKHLEGLLKDRINFYLIFSSIFILGSFSIPDLEVRELMFVAGALVSLLIGVAVWRTHLLVSRALEALPETHPYKEYKATVPWFIPNANYALSLIPVVLTLLFAWLALRGFEGREIFEQSWFERYLCPGRT